MDGYLNTPRISKPKPQAAGGVLQYWENARATQPRLAQMALDFLSAPGIFLASQLTTSNEDQ